jgi:hypothetical protein
MRISARSRPFSARMILPAGRPPEISAGAPAKPLPPDEFPVLAWGISVAALTMAKAPTTDAIAAELTVPERVLPFLPLDLEKTEIGGWTKPLS